MTDNQLWTSIMVIIGLVAVALMGAFTGYYKHQNEVIAAMVKDGVDPVAAKCALQDDYGRNPTCLVLAARK